MKCMHCKYLIEFSYNTKYGKASVCSKCLTINLWDKVESIDELELNVRIANEE
jgi:hypothetical protein